MENNKKSFLLPLSILIIALVIIATTTYFFTLEKTPEISLTENIVGSIGYKKATYGGEIPSTWNAVHYFEREEDLDVQVNQWGESNPNRESLVMMAGPDEDYGAGMCGGGCDFPPQIMVYRLNGRDVRNIIDEKLSKLKTRQSFTQATKVNYGFDDKYSFEKIRIGDKDIYVESYFQEKAGLHNRNFYFWWLERGRTRVAGEIIMTWGSEKEIDRFIETIDLKKYDESVGLYQDPTIRVPDRPILGSASPREGWTVIYGSNFVDNATVQFLHNGQVFASACGRAFPGKNELSVDAQNLDLTTSDRPANQLRVVNIKCGEPMYEIDVEKNSSDIVNIVMRSRNTFSF